MEHQDRPASNVVEEDHNSGMAIFFGGIGILVAAGLISLAIWYIFGQRFTLYFILPFLIGAGMALAGIYQGLSDSGGPMQLFWRLAVFTVTLGMVGWTGVYAYTNTIGAPPPDAPPAHRLNWSGSSATLHSRSALGTMTEFTGNLTNRDTKWRVEQISIVVTPTVESDRSPGSQSPLPSDKTILLDNLEVAPGETAHYSERILMPLGTAGFDEEIKFVWSLK